jgi:transcription termination/antitermination protein NusA
MSIDEDTLEQMLKEEEVIRLFEQLIPEVRDGRVEIKAIARQAPWRTKIALSCRDKGIDCIGVCIGHWGCRIRQVIDQLDGERIDLVRWDDSLEKFIANAFQPARVNEVSVNGSRDRATVSVDRDQLLMVMGRRGLNRQLAGRLCGCQIEIVSGPDTPWSGALEL